MKGQEETRINTEKEILKFTRSTINDLHLGGEVTKDELEAIEKCQQVTEESTAYRAEGNLFDAQDKLNESFKITKKLAEQNPQKFAILKAFFNSISPSSDARKAESSSPSSTKRTAAEQSNADNTASKGDTSDGKSEWTGGFGWVGDVSQQQSKKPTPSGKSFENAFRESLKKKQNTVTSAAQKPPVSTVLSNGNADSKTQRLDEERKNRDKSQAK